MRLKISIELGSLSHEGSRRKKNKLPYVVILEDDINSQTPNYFKN